MAGFRIDSFKGMRPRISALKLNPGEAQIATNSELGSGDLKPWLEIDAGLAVTSTYFNRTIYLFDNAGDPKWFEWDDFVTVARGSVKGDDEERTYFTGDDFPKMTYRTIATAGGGPFPTSFRKLGVPAPATAPTVSGIELPESVDPDLRRSTPGSMITKLFEIVFVNWTTYTVTADTQWNLNAGWVGDIEFDLAIGSTIKILEVIDEDTLRIGSATGTGALAATKKNDTTDTTYYNAFDNNTVGNADFVGWRLPDGVQVEIPGHKLRVGDVIRVTRLDQVGGLLFQATVTDDFFEQNWTTEADVTIGGATFKQTGNARIAASTDATVDFPALAGGFYYDVDRPESIASESEDRSYVYTYVTALGEEGPPSPVSSTLNALDGDSVLITGIELPPTAYYEITHMRIYRTNSTAAGTEFQLVGNDIPVAVTTTETVLSQHLGEVLNSTFYDPPPETMQGITAMPNGMLVGFVGKNLHFCEPYFPHAWPAIYDQAVDYNIVALAAFGNSVVVLTEGVPYIVTASHPRNANARPYKINQACVSAQSIATTTDRVLYASPDGLVELGINGASLVTQDVFTKKEWDAYVPSSIAAEIHDGKYIGFFDGGLLVPQSPAAVFLTGTVVDVGFTPGEADILAGGLTIILDLVSDTWEVAAGSAFDNIRQDILDGITSSTDFNTGWNAQTQTVTDVVRTSDTKVTITLSALASYSITANEIISCIVPASAMILGVALPADQGFSILPITTYSSRVIVFSDFDAGGTDIPHCWASQYDVEDWDIQQGVGTDATENVSFKGAAFAPSLNRWLAVGFRDAGAAFKPGTQVFVTSEDNGLTWTQRNSATPTATTKAPRTAVWYKEYSTFVVGGDNGSLQTSIDGITWVAASFDASVPATVSLRDLVIASGAASPYIYAGCSSANFLLRSPDLDLFPASYTWAKTTVAYATATGTKHMASGGGRIVSVGNYDTDAELNYTLHGATSSTNIGVISTFDCTGIVYGDDTWAMVDLDGRVITCASGDEGTIGNWSAPSAAIASGTTIRGIIHDEGDGTTPGYGWIAYGDRTIDSLSRVFTSPDLVTWTLQATASAGDEVATTAAVSYPESQLGTALANFAPTYNGSQAPNLLGFARAQYATNALGRGLISTAYGAARMTVKVTATDAIIAADYIRSGGAVSTGGSQSADEPAVFNLNTVPDSVRIRIAGTTSVGSSATDGTNSSEKEYYVSGNDMVQIFTEDQFFVPLVGEEYGFRPLGFGYAQNAAGIENETANAIGKTQSTVEFTFRKNGYNDLIVSYLVEGKGTAQASDLN